MGNIRVEDEISHHVRNDNGGAWMLVFDDIVLKWLLENLIRSEICID